MAKQPTYTRQQVIDIVRELDLFKVDYFKSARSVAKESIFDHGDVCIMRELQLFAAAIAEHAITLERKRILALLAAERKVHSPTAAANNGRQSDFAFGSVTVVERLEQEIIRKRMSE